MEDNENTLNQGAVIIRDLATKTAEKYGKTEAFNATLDRRVRHIALIPDGINLTQVKGLDAKVPEHIWNFIDSNSFTEYMKAYLSQKESRLFASLNQMKLQGIVDYQKISNTPSEAVDGECKHQCFLKIIETEDFKAWRNINDKPLSQAEFVVFLMERAHCVVSPDQARILEIASTLEIKNDVTFSSRERRSDGGFDLNYREDIQTSAGANGKIKVPDTLKLKMTAFEGGVEMELAARMYYTLHGGTVTFRIKILNLRETILKTFRSTCDKIAKDLKLSIHYTE